jgi:hypothetical protein
VPTAVEPRSDGAPGGSANRLKGTQRVVRRRTGSLLRAAKWTAAAVASLLLALGVQSAWHRASRWISPPPPPVAEQIDSLVRIAAQHRFALLYQSTARLHPGRDLSYIFVFKPDRPIGEGPFPPPPSELRIYDLRHGSLRLAYRLQPLTRFEKVANPWTFGVNVLNVSDLDGNGADEIVAALVLYAVDSVPTFPVVVRWHAATESYAAEPVMSRSARPELHGSREWTRGYLGATTIWNGAEPRERFASYHAEGVQVEPGTMPVLLGIFYASARSRSQPTRLEVNVWSLSGDTYGVCSVGTKYPTPPLFIKVAGPQTYDALMSGTWADVRSKTFCY